DHSEMRLNVENVGFCVLILNPHDITWSKTNANSFTDHSEMRLNKTVGFCIPILNPHDITWSKTNANSFTDHSEMRLNVVKNECKQLYHAGGSSLNNVFNV
ncbi:uncharacterized protein LACBIDRAFT_336145, partial [Laccaria bicolor S238N-H82]